MLPAVEWSSAPVTTSRTWVSPRSHVSHAPRTRPRFAGEGGLAGGVQRRPRQRAGLARGGVRDPQLDAGLAGAGEGHALAVGRPGEAIRRGALGQRDLRLDLAARAPLRAAAGEPEEREAPPAARAVRRVARGVEPQAGQPDHGPGQVGERRERLALEEEEDPAGRVEVRLGRGRGEDHPLDGRGRAAPGRLLGQGRDGREGQEQERADDHGDLRGVARLSVSAWCFCFVSGRRA